MKYVLFTGEGEGFKGVTAKSIAVVLKACGLRVTCIIIDPFSYLDVPPEEEHEVFVLDDGGEVDPDVGTYEQFLDVTLTSDHIITTGKIYKSVLDKESKGDYLGNTVKVVPHITDAIKEKIESVAAVPVDGKDGSADVCVIELGGTFGYIESLPFIEALRQLNFTVGQENFCLFHTSLMYSIGNESIKSTQESVSMLRALGLTPNLLACRSNEPLLDTTKEKLSHFCQIPAANILNNHYEPYIWHVPLLWRNQNAHGAILKQINLLDVAQTPDLQEWAIRAEALVNKKTVKVKIAVVGNYNQWNNCDLSVAEALLHACIACERKPSIDWITASDLEEDTENQKLKQYESARNTLETADCILVPGGFGDGGIKGMILAAQYARENKIPYLGICLGLQISVIEFARSVLGWEKANNEEFVSRNDESVVIFMPEGSKRTKTITGESMRLGSRRTFFQTRSCVTSKLYHSSEYVDERHRHRYEVNPDVICALEKAGLKFVGRDKSGKRMEILELPSHPYYVGVQFHPEHKSRLGKPSPPLVGLILAATGRLDAYLETYHN